MILKTEDIIPIIPQNSENCRQQKTVCRAFALTARLRLRKQGGPHIQPGGFPKTKFAHVHPRISYEVGFKGYLVFLIMYAEEILNDIDRKQGHNGPLLLHMTEA